MTIVVLVVILRVLTPPSTDPLARAAQSRRRSCGLRSLRLVSLALPLSALLVGCSPSVQLYGDSTQDMAAPLLQARIKGIENRAVGSTRSDMLLMGTDGKNGPWPTEVRAPVVVINHGMNDARPWARVGIATYKENLRKLAQAPARVIFQTPNPSTYPGRDTTPYAQAMREVAAEMNLLVIDVHSCFMQQPDWQDKLYDQVHPTPEGLRYIVDVCIAPSLSAAIN